MYPMKEVRHAMTEAYKVFKGGNLIDGTGKEPIENGVMVIKGDRIESAGRMGAVDYPQEAEIIEVEGKTVMPGLIDAHLHLAGLTTLNNMQYVVEHPYLRVARAAVDAWRLVDTGFTTVRDCASYHALHLRQAVDEGSLIGPRIVSCGKAITQTGGHMDEGHSLPLEWVLQGDFCRVADGPDECRRAVREQFRAGADFIKIATTGGVMSERGSPTSTQFTVDEIRAVVEEARAAGKKVAAHAQGNQGIRNALLGGVDSIEHGVFLDEEAIEMMVERGVFLVPTLAVVDALVNRGHRAGIRKGSLNKARSVMDALQDSFLRAWQKGIKLGLGTDYILSPVVVGDIMGDHAIELELYVKAGLTEMEAIVCATKNNAELLGMSDLLGTLEAGKLADCLVIQGDPLKDIRVLRNKRNILKVYKGGSEVSRLP
jgi:imidazolonepropionase-like amidohydrolase